MACWTAVSKRSRVSFIGSRRHGQSCQRGGLPGRRQTDRRSSAAILDLVESVTVGRWGLRVSRLCLGTMIFGSQVDEPRAFAVMDRAAELGIDFIDVADVYPVPPSPETWGRTEEIVGRWLASRGRRSTVATKCVNRVGLGANDAGGSRKHVIEACDASLRRLQVERLDILYL